MKSTLCCAVLSHSVEFTLCNLVDCSPPGSYVHGDSPGKNTRMGCHAFLQGIFPTQGSNPGLPHCRSILYHLSHWGRSKSTLRQSNSSSSGSCFLHLLYLAHLKKKKKKQTVTMAKCIHVLDTLPYLPYFNAYFASLKISLSLIFLNFVEL